MKFKTAISKIEQTKQLLRGYNLTSLLNEKTFTEVIYLLLKGQLPKQNELSMFNALLIACSDHGAGAPSSTVARISISAGTSPSSALASGILTMGKAHGLAINEAAQFFKEHKNNKDINKVIKTLREQKVKIPGFGHRVLLQDYRAVSLFSIAKEQKIFGEYCKLALKVEEALNEVSSKQIPLNIDGALAAILSDMQFDKEIMNSIFIIGRIPGLLAHIYEEQKNNEGLKRIAPEDEEYIEKSN